LSQTPAISVVLGVYNGKRYIAESIESVLCQTFGDFEFIIVDDGSTDGTLDILQRYEAKDSRVRVIPIPHAGIVAAANTGVNAARAPLIARVDADDITMPERFELQIRYMAEHPEVVCLGSRMFLMEPYGSIFGESHHELTHDEIDTGLLRGSGWVMPQPVAMMRREAVVKIGAYRDEYLWVEDLDLFLRLAEVGRLANLPEKLVKYRNHPASTNHRLPQLQFDLSRKCVIETYRRRGLPVPEDLNLISPFQNRMIDKYLNWGWAALRDKNVKGAREHAWRAFKENPVALHAWKIMYCAWRGH
jgi:glycosyltransferase involved in cell wall biosynthesis